MHRLLLILWCMLVPALAVRADPILPSAAWDSRPLLTRALQEGDDRADESRNGQNGGKDDKKESAPEHIKDNAFLVDEALNQEPGEVQHTLNWINFWDRAAGTRTRDFTCSYNMELPLGSQKHQVSFTVPLQTAFEKPPAGRSFQQGDIGDVFLEYRYQLLGAGEARLWCAPSFTLILPTGDERFGTGNGELGYEVGLPASYYGERFDFHLNLGTTCIPDVSVPLQGGLIAPGRDLHGYELGSSVYWKPRVNFHVFVEMLAEWTDEISDTGVRVRQTELLLNPGFRYAICLLDEVEWVVGLSAPIGLTRDAPDIGLFAYMSVEHMFRKVNGNGN